MLIFTTNSLEDDVKTMPWPDWLGLHILVVLPGASPNYRELKTDKNLVIVEWLKQPESTTDLFFDILNWVRPLQDENEGPLLYIDTPITEDKQFFIPDTISKYTVQANFNSDNRISQAVLGEMIATSPLLLEFFKTAKRCELGDKAMLELLEDILSWDK